MHRRIASNFALFKMQFCKMCCNLIRFVLQVIFYLWNHRKLKVSNMFKIYLKKRRQTFVCGYSMMLYQSRIILCSGFLSSGENSSLLTFFFLGTV